MESVDGAAVRGAKAGSGAGRYTHVVRRVGREGFGLVGERGDGLEM